VSNLLIEPTWKEIYYHVYPHLKKDRSFSAKDIIRIYHHNLTWEEQQEVKEYFCETQCVDEIDLPEEPLPLPPVPPLPLLPILPPLLPPSVPPALPPPPVAPQQPPVLPNFIIPVFPFIIPSLLPEDILRFILDAIGESEAHAATIPDEETIDWRERYFTIRTWLMQTWKDLEREKKRAEYWEFIAGIGPRVVNVTIYLPEEEKKPYEWYWEDPNIEESLFPEEEEEKEEEEEEYYYEGEVTDLTHAESVELRIVLDDVMPNIETIAEEKDIDFYFEGWLRIGETIWYYVRINGERFEIKYEEVLELEEEVTDWVEQETI